MYAVGDVHGRRDLLEALLEKISIDDAKRPSASTSVVLLGDLVDRGPDSRGVIDYLLSIYLESPWRFRFVMGNHDELFLNAAHGNLKALRMLIRVGGKQTILSYGVTEGEYEEADFQALSNLLVERIPESHLDFLRAFENCCEIGDYLFVHAGIRPNVPLELQKPSDLRWIRQDFLSSRLQHPRMVVHGHSISSREVVKNNRIGIDTGAFFSGRLTAAGLEGANLWFLSAQGEADTSWGPVTD